LGWSALANLALLPLQRRQGFGETTGVVKLLIDRSKADVGDIIQLQQLHHHHLTNLAGGHLAGAPTLQRPLNLFGSASDLFGSDGALLTCLHHAQLNLLAVE